MVNRNESNTPNHDAKRDKRSFSSTQFRPNRSPSDLSPDELIRSLANAVENKRARQVGEWESMLKNDLQPPIASYR